MGAPTIEPPDARAVVRDVDLTIYVGHCIDVLRALADATADAVVTSPPYLNARPEYTGPSVGEYHLVFDELARVVTGPMLWNVGRIWRDGVEQLWWTKLIDAARDAGWEHWDTGLWLKPNANPIHGRVFTDSHEYILVFGRAGVTLNEDALRIPHAASTVSRFGRAWVNHKGVKDAVPSKARKTRAVPNPEGGRAASYLVAHVGREKGNRHPAPMALEIAEDLVRLASWPGQTVLDPFAGSGTTAVAARKQGRRSILIERDPAYAAMAAARLGQQCLLASAGAA